LAHIAAKQAGYRPVELNASDDRSGKVIRERITSAQEAMDVRATMLATNGNSNNAALKPALVILDEVDGMEGGPTGGVTELVKLIKATEIFKNHPSQQSQRPGFGGNNSYGNKDKKKDNDGDGDSSDSDGDGDGDGPSNKKGNANTNSKKPAAAANKKFGRKGDNDDDDNNDGDDKENGNKSSNQPYLRGPVICICNDLYAPVLRDLRPLAYVVELTKAPQERLMTRLKYVCQQEGLPIANDALQALCTVTDNDIRACLNTLHFLKYASSYSSASTTTGLARPRITADDVTKAAVGVKDQSQAVYDLWCDTFKSPSSSSNTAVIGKHLSQAFHRYAASTRKVASTDPTASAFVTQSKLYHSYLWQQMSAYSSEPKLLLSGLHENAHAFGSNRINDPSMEATCKALDWLCYGEEIASRSMGLSGGAGVGGGTGGSGSAGEGGGIGRYIAVAGLGFHLNMASVGGSNSTGSAGSNNSSASGNLKLSWPRTEGNNRRRQEVKRQVVEAMLQERASNPGGYLPPCGAMDRRALVLDMISPILSIVNPRLRSIQPTLYNSREKKQAEDLVSALASCGLTYGQRPELKYGAFGNNNNSFYGQRNGGASSSFFSSASDSSRYILKP
jgi:DNA polymerase III delta prime subunit